ncbi:hypothetical protein J6590_018405 [Homalodisca vitripennis]|nr:hypothetical protein J6590_018405 [Homalodisca vitripennis]
MAWLVVTRRCDRGVTDGRRCPCCGPHAIRYTEPYNTVLFLSDLSAGNISFETNFILGLKYLALIITCDRGVTDGRRCPCCGPHAIRYTEPYNTVLFLSDLSAGRVSNISFETNFILGLKYLALTITCDRGVTDDRRCPCCGPHAIRYTEPYNTVLFLSDLSAG